MKKKNKRGSFIRGDKIERQLPGQELVIRRVRKLEEIEKPEEDQTFQVQILVRVLGRQKEHLNYAVIADDLRKAIDKL